MSAYYGPGTDDLSFVPLTVEEEKDLFTKFYAGDLAARDKIIQHHLKLVAKLSLKFAKRVLPEDDAISAGNFGLLQALESKQFDINRGVRFATYLRFYVRGQICTAIRRLGENHQSTGHEHTTLPEDAAVTGIHGGKIDVLNHNTRGKNPGPYNTDLAEPSVDHEYENLQLNQERRAALEKAISTLPHMEQVSIRMVALEGKGHPDVAAKEGVSRQASQQAYWRGMAKLKVLLAEQYNELK